MKLAMNRSTYKGYTILEILLGTIAVVLIALAIIPIVGYYNRINQAQTIASQSINYSKIFIKYLLDNDSSIRSSLTSTNSVVYVKWTTIDEGGYIPSGNISSTTVLGQTPCMAVSINTTINQLTPYLFFVGGNLSKEALLDADTVMNQIGAMAGVYSTSSSEPSVLTYGSGVFSAGNAWYLLNSSPYISGISNGCGANIVENSIVINLGMMPEYASMQSSDDQSLHRYADTDSGYSLGQTGNTNTLSTDISMIESGLSYSHKIYFSGNNESGMYLWNNGSNSNITVQNGGFSANTLQPTSSVATFTSCASGDVGTMAQQSDINVPVKSQLQCSYDALQCQGIDPTGKNLNGYCYLPVVSVSINYKPNTSLFTCPVGYIDNSVPPVINTNTPVLTDSVVASEFSMCMLMYSNMPYGGNATLCSTTATFDSSSTCLWVNPEVISSKIGGKSYKGYSIYTGLLSTLSWDWTLQAPDGPAYQLQSLLGFIPPICPQLLQQSTSLITSATCTTANPTVTYD